MLKSRRKRANAKRKKFRESVEIINAERKIVKKESADSERERERKRECVERKRMREKRKSRYKYIKND